MKPEMKGDTSRWGKRADIKPAANKRRRGVDKVEVAEAPAIEEVLAEDRLAFAEALGIACDNELRARYRPLLALFYGEPPKWLKDFCDGGPLVLPDG